LESSEELKNELSRLEKEVGRLKEELRVSESKHKNLEDNLTVGVGTISPKMEVRSVNALLSQWFPGADVSKRPLCYKVFNDPPRDVPCPSCPAIKTISDGATHEAMINITVGGKASNYRIISAPVKDKAGNVIFVVMIIENITARIKVERELFKKLHDLEVFQKSAVDREIKMIEQKKRIRSLEERVARLEDGK